MLGGRGVPQIQYESLQHVTTYTPTLHNAQLVPAQRTEVHGAISNHLQPSDRFDLDAMTSTHPPT